MVTMGSESLAAGARASLGGVLAQLQAREREKRSHGVIQKVGNNTINIPIALSASGAMGALALDGGVLQERLRESIFEKVVHTWKTSGYAPQRGVRGN